MKTKAKATGRIRRILAMDALLLPRDAVRHRIHYEDAMNAAEED